MTPHSPIDQNIPVMPFGKMGCSLWIVARFLSRGHFGHARIPWILTSEVGGEDGDALHFSSSQLNSSFANLTTTSIFISVHAIRKWGMIRQSGIQEGSKPSGRKQ